MTEPVVYALDSRGRAFRCLMEDGAPSALCGVVAQAVPLVVCWGGPGAECRLRALTLARALRKAGWLSVHVREGRPT